MKRTQRLLSIGIAFGTILAIGAAEFNLDQTRLEIHLDGRMQAQRACL